MNNTTKLIIAQRELIKYMQPHIMGNIWDECKKLRKKIAKLEQKIIEEETIKTK